MSIDENTEEIFTTIIAYLHFDYDVAKFGEKTSIRAMHIQNFDPYDFSKKEIDGVPVYYKNIPWAPCINIRVVFNTGAFNDPVGKEGLSHFLEHMIFDGSPLLDDKKAIRAWSKINALNSWNAWTGYSKTTYWLKCLPENFEKVLIGMKDMIFKPHLRPEDVEHERKVITQEAWGRYQNEKYLNYIKEAIQIVFSGHSHERISSPLGWPDTISKITAEDIVSWHKNNYGKGNFFIVLTGAVSDSDIKLLSAFVEGVPEASLSEKKEEKYLKPRLNRVVKKADEIGEVKEQVEISISRFNRDLPYEKNEIARMYQMLLSDMLHERLRIEHSLCYSVKVFFSMDNSYSHISIIVNTEEKNIDLVEQEVKKLIQEIEDGKHEARFELNKASKIERSKSTERLSDEIADETLQEVSKYNGHIISLEEQWRFMEAVTYKNIIDFSKSYMDQEYVFTEIILPSSK